MENLGEWERKNLINELIQGMELARQLQLHLNSPPTSSSNETQQLLVTRVVASYEKVLSMLNWSSPVVEQQLGGGGATVRMSESPPSLAGSPQHSGDSDPEQEPRDASKKRKAVPRWSKQVRISPGVGLEGPLDDGYTWRKYGQKDILGAKYPRGYYKCTNRNIQGCLATKQVQRSDDDPTIYEITYRGRHTCNQPPPLTSPPIALAVGPLQIREHHPFPPPFNFFPEPNPSHTQQGSHSSGLLENITGSFPPPFTPSVAPETNCLLISPGTSFAHSDGWSNLQKSDTDHLSEIFSTSGASSAGAESGFAYGFNQKIENHPGPFN